MSQTYNRTVIPYTDAEKEINTSKASVILVQIQQLEDSKKSEIFDNQLMTALKICRAFQKPHVSLVLTVAPTQSGKTGTMLGLMKALYSFPDYSPPNPDNIWVITGLSDCSWKSQTTARMPEFLQDRVLHRPDLVGEFQETIKTMRDALIIIDEAQIACKVGQTLHKVFAKGGLLNLKQIAERNIRIVMFTATPSGLRQEISAWGNHCEMVMMDTPESYVSPMNLIEHNQIFECKDIGGVDKFGQLRLPIEQLMQNLKELQQVVVSYPDASYHLVRVHKGIMGDAAIENVMEVFKTTELDIEFFRYFGNPTIKGKNMRESIRTMKPIVGDINRVLSKQPTKHTIIFIKDRLRCAKTLVKKYIGLEYERYSSAKNDEVSIQGIRATGYDHNPRMTIFANRSSVENYQKLFDTRFLDNSVEWRSGTTKYRSQLKKQEAVPTFLGAVVKE